MIIPFEISRSLDEKCRRMGAVLSAHDRVAIAYSGGADSTFVAWFMRHILSRDPLACLVVTPFLSERELTRAGRTTQEIGVHLELIHVDTTLFPEVRENSMERCYHCKRAIMVRLRSRAGELGCSLVVDGTHSGEQGRRPGRRALDELGILSPLAMAGFTKSDIRELSRLAGLSTWNKPSESCLATRVPYGTVLTRDLLTRIEEAEALIHRLGCRQVRVRVHDRLARIEVDEDAFPLLLERESRAEIIHRFRQLSFDHVTLDLAGFRSGCWDEPIEKDS